MYTHSCADYHVKTVVQIAKLLTGPVHWSSHQSSEDSPHVSPHAETSNKAYMTKRQKVRKSWLKILTVNKIWSNYTVLVLHLVFRNGPKSSGHNINIYAEVHMEIFAWEGDLSSEIRLMKTDNVTVTDFFDDYVHVHNTQTSLILQRITKEASLYIIQ